MPALSEYSNVHATAFRVIADKGFRVWYDAHHDAYFAERDGWDLRADSPCGLLGLVAIFEHVGPSEFREYWWRLERDFELPRQAPDYRPVWQRD